jgi:hypothetical protein
MFTTDQLAAIDVCIIDLNQQAYKALAINFPNDQGTKAVNFSSWPSVTPLNPYLNQGW